MSKRAVIISYETLKEFITKGYMIESIECLEGIPEDAVLVDMFPDTFRLEVVMVFESANWDGEPSGYTVDSPVHGIVPCHKVNFRKYFSKDDYEKTLSISGNRFKVSSKTPITILAGKNNKNVSCLDSGALACIGDWTDIEELT